MKKYRQQIVDSKIGDCFRACMATILQLPPEVLPNDHSPMWFSNWNKYLSQFGLGIQCNSAKEPIWYDAYWIAGVTSKNFERSQHAIVMHDTHRVFHDPTTKKRYRTGESLLGKQLVHDGTHLVVTNALKLHRLEEYRNKIAEG
jgi:hypothetical protein